MTPICAAALAGIAALISMSAAASCWMRRRSSTSAAATELEQAVEELVRRLEATAGRCIHDLESRQAQVSALLNGQSPCEVREPALALEHGGGEDQPGERLETDLVSRVARACELAERHADEATICRLTGMQRAELRLALSLRRAA